MMSKWMFRNLALSELTYLCQYQHYVNYVYLLIMYVTTIMVPLLFNFIPTDYVLDLRIETSFYQSVHW